MITVNIIGTGNVAWHLAKVISVTTAYQLQSVAGRSATKRDAFKKFTQQTCSIKDIETADITIIAVSDSAISDVAFQIPYTKSLVVHTSGSVAMDILSIKNRKGVFYPLQTFSQDAEVTFKEIPICLEAAHEDDMVVLRKLAFALSKKVYAINSKQRKQLHLAAVFANNFTNHCYTIAKDLCDTEDISFELLHPLMLATAKKATEKDPDLVQTGPAKRGDQETISAHLSTIKKEEHQLLYETLTASIYNHYGKKL